MPRYYIGGTPLIVQVPKDFKLDWPISPARATPDGTCYVNVPFVDPSRYQMPAEVLVCWVPGTDRLEDPALVLEQARDRVAKFTPPDLADGNSRDVVTVLKDPLPTGDYSVYVLGRFDDPPAVTPSAPSA